MHYLRSELPRTLDSETINIMHYRLSTDDVNLGLVPYHYKGDEDYGYLLAGIKNGIVFEERLDEAVTRILATKAALHLPEKKAAGTLVPGPEAFAVVGCEKFRAWARDVADKAVTLVRDKQKLLPISAEKFPRLYLNVIQKSMEPDDPTVQQWKALFEKEGFSVTVRDRRVRIEPFDLGNPALPPKSRG